ncbi:hypothetical protein BD309DRAFT_966396 [Dichomitus squalens]|nr:hypothetical protein BD309DRAFT_966396 [Dichomitus squalens]
MLSKLFFDTSNCVETSTVLRRHQRFWQFDFSPSPLYYRALASNCIMSVKNMTLLVLFIGPEVESGQQYASSSECSAPSAGKVYYGSTQFGTHAQTRVHRYPRFDIGFRQVGGSGPERPVLTKLPGPMAFKCYSWDAILRSCDASSIVCVRAYVG